MFPGCGLNYADPAHHLRTADHDLGDLQTVGDCALSVQCGNWGVKCPSLLRHRPPHTRELSYYVVFTRHGQALTRQLRGMSLVVSDK